MDAGRRHETPGFEMKDGLLLLAMAGARVSAFLCWGPEPQFHRVKWRGPNAQARGCITGEEP